MERIKHLIVQAGGKGARMGCLTENKPKCLVSIRGKPLLYSLSDSFPKADLYVISDYKSDILEKYLKVVSPKFAYTVIKAEGKGTCAGIQEARNLIPEGESFAIVWSDLLFDEKIKIPLQLINKNCIGLTKNIKCRWTYKDGKLAEVPGKDAGVVGFFYFGDPQKLPEIPSDGEFVKFLSEKVQGIVPLLIDKIYEVGALESFAKIQKQEVNSRFFNYVEFIGGRIVKKARDPSFSVLLEREAKWYKYVSNHGYNYVPKIYNYKPYLEMERINGIHPYEYVGLDKKSRARILTKIFDALEKLHSIDSINSSKDVLNEVYVGKTLQRISKISLLIPESETEFYVVNGRKVRNLLVDKFKEIIQEAVSTLEISEKFSVIHGDPTFSNIMIENESQRPILFDPRGYFGSLEIFGDPMYDFAKLYYSVVGNYDQFNQRNFRLHITGNKVDIEIRSNGWEDCSEMFNEKFGDKMREMKILHALIWLSLAGYVLDDYDSILAAYFHGLELFEEAANT